MPPGQSSSLLVDLLHEGDILDVKAPGGHFFLDLSAEGPVVLVGGGIGVTPLISMLTAICESGSTRETWLFYGVRNSRDHIMGDHLRRLAEDHGNVRLCVCYSRPLATDVEGRDYHEAGRVSLDLFRRLLPSRGYEFYVCGPPPMMKSIVTGLRDWGVSDEHVFYELFGAETVRNAKTDTPANPALYRIDFAASGKTCTWDPSAESLLAFAESNGVAIESGCRAGNCGSCVTTIRSGEVDHIVEPGAEHEEGSCLACIAVPKSDLVLDA
jgi:ferredoxin-NADP reductase